MSTVGKTLLLTAALAAMASPVLANAPETLHQATVVEPEPLILSETGQVIYDQLTAVGEEAAPLIAVYQIHNFEPIWDPIKLSALMGALSSAPDHALPVARYADPGLNATDPAERDLAASRVFLSYARDLTSGVLEPRSADRDIVVAPKRPDQSR